jgi:cytochrome c-type biogenesis protein CcmH
MDDMLARLEARLASQGGTDADWELLEESYEVVGRAADAQSARSHHVPGTPSASRGAQASVPASPGAAASTASGDAAQLDGVVEIADQLKSIVPAGLTLFIVAKAVNSPGPPVGVMRATTSQWPVRFRLDDASAMVPGRTLSSAGSVTVQARISRSGMAAPQPGDFQSGISTVNPHDRKPVRLLIDQVIGQGQ